MHLTLEEQKILGGEKGAMLRKSLELLISIGEAFDAPEMTTTNSVHIPCVAIGNLPEGGRRFIDEIINSGARFETFTTTNTIGTDYDSWQQLGTPEEEGSRQVAVVDALCVLGAIPCLTCTPHLVGHVPRFGEHIVWGEISAVVYANSVLGARTNPEGGPSALASALTVRTPRYGLHLQENRIGQFVVRVKAELREAVEYGALGSFASKVHEELIPVFTGMPKRAEWDGLKMLSGGIAGKSIVPLFHAVGITPEARTEEQALGGRRPVDAVDFGEKELEETLCSLDKGTKKEVSWVAIGCPHCSIAEIKEVVGLLNGRKVHSNVALWVCTSRAIKTLADHMHLTEAIEQCGGKIVCDTCPALVTPNTVRNLRFQSITTNSVVMTFYAPHFHGLEMNVGRLSQCMDAAVSGTWR